MIGDDGDREQRAGTGDAAFMDRAIGIAQGGWGRVHPNPLVGAVIVKNGRVVGEGWHAEYGGPHAEVNALAAAGEAARGATMYVTLEPCAHHGKTPPCTEAIVVAGLERVVYAAADPNRGAAGGASALAARGLEVAGGVRADEARALDPAFHWIHERQRPWVALKLAMSMDARISREPGRPTAVTGEAARAATHRLRAGFDAILVGRGTMEADDPLLTVRGDVRPRVPPARIVFDSQARTPPGSRLLETLDEAPVWIVCAADAPDDRVETLRKAGARMLPVPADSHGIIVEDALTALWNEGITSILCEGGGRLAASLLERRVVGRVHLFIAPDLFGENAVPAFPLTCVDGGWRIHEVSRVGQDAFIVVDCDNGEA
jgi:diaminohydroxyphosphoribosylaminopyrimidine deaminase/5-amino-6-(5-phosphoribosylamino)uracil reductase